MRELDPSNQEKILDLLNNKMSKTQNIIANPQKASETVCATIKRYRHKVIIDLKKLLATARNDPENKSNKLHQLLKDLEQQHKIRTAHEKTIEEQKKLIDELMARKVENPDLKRVRSDDNGSPLPPIRSRNSSIDRGRGGRLGSGRGRGGVVSPTKSNDQGNKAMFQFSLDMGGGDGPMGGMGMGGPQMGGGGGGMGRGGPQLGRGGPQMGRGGPGMGRGGPQLGRGGPRMGGQGGMGQGGPQFGGPGGGRAGGRGARGMRRY